MPQSLSRVLIHLVFSTKNREPCIVADVRPRLHGYIVGILDHLKSPSIQTCGVADHVHILFALGRTITQAQIVEEVKTGTSKWMKADRGVPGFSWQAGYGAFSIGESQVETAVQYIQNQEEHHRKLTFQDEYRKFLERYNITYDESGLIPIIDQGREYLAGYTNDPDLQYNGKLPLTVFGDHTRILKWVARPFALGADGTQILRGDSCFDQRFFYYALKSVDLKHFGYERHFKYLKEKEIPLPDLPTQRRIAGILMSECYR